MDAKRLAKILPTVVGIGFCAAEVVNIFVLGDSANAPDARTGHTEAALFAPAVSTDWSYVTHTQILIMIAVTGTVLLLAALMFVLQIRNKIVGDDANENDPPDAPHRDVPPAQPTSNKRTAFGRARRA